MVDARQDRLIDVHELAELLSVRPAQVRRMALDGAIPALRLSRRGPWRFRVADVLASLEVAR